MNTTGTESWHDTNQRHLSAALGAVKEALRRHAGLPPGAPEDVESPSVTGYGAAASGPPALETLCGAFGLSVFERDVLVLCAGLELDASVAALCAAAQDDPRRPYPTFWLALAALPAAHWSALGRSSPLRHWRLVEPGAGDALTTSQLRVSERVLHHLTGVRCLDEYLEGLLAPVRDPEGLPPSQQALARRIAGLWSGSSAPDGVQIQGDVGDAEAVAATACAALGLSLYTVRAGDIPETPTERGVLARLWVRESVLDRGALLVDCGDGEVPRAVIPFLESVRGVVFVVARDPVRPPRRPLVRFEVRRPDPAEQRGLWSSVLGPLAGALNGRLDEVSAQFALGPRGIRAVGTEVVRTASLSPEEEPGSVLWEACRSQARARLDDLALRVEPAAGWDDLILPAPQARMLREIVANVRRRTRVYEAWGFAGKGSRGLGISALFAGASGTGKTMAAEVLAGELELDLYRVDLSRVVSKYIGETEKNLRRVFDAAEEGGAVLLFDEADALFGKRGEVRDSHDRYANIEVSYLLQRMEEYRGLAILTTNMKDELDPAFMRRLRFVVRFPFPDAARRARIWARIFPAGTPTEGLDTNRLARLNVAGGNIRNIALQAAFLAADAGEPVRMDHLLRAAHTEYAKLEKSPTESEIGGWQ